MRTTPLTAPGLRIQRGVALVETVIVLPLLLFLLISIAELGRAMYQYNTLQKTARDAVRYLADAAICDDSGVINIDGCGARATTRNLAVYGSPVAGTPLLPGLNIGNVLPSSPDSTHVRVEITYSYEPIAFAAIPGLGLASDITLPTSFTVTATMRAL